MKSKKIPTYLKYYLSKTRLNGLVFNKTYLENLSGTSFYLDHSIEDKIKINFKASESTQESVPTLENPQDVHVVKGDNEVIIKNSNLFNQTNPTYRSSDTASYELIENGIRIINNNVGTSHKVIFQIDTTNIDTTNKKLLIKSTIGSNSTSTFYGYQIFGSNSIDTTGTILGQDTQPTSEKQITINNNYKYINFSLMVVGSTSQQKNVYTDYLNIYVGFNNYTTYKQQSYPINLEDLEMCKIGDYADELFKNVPECEYYEESLEIGKWYKYGRIGKMILTGSDDEDYYQLSVNDDIMRFQLRNVQNYIKPLTRYIANYFKFLGYNHTFYEIGISNTSNASTSAMFFFLKKELATSVTEFKAWLSTHNTEVYYVLETTENILLSDTLQIQLDNIYNNAHTYNKITNIEQVNEDRPFILDISYYRKIK